MPIHEEGSSMKKLIIAAVLTVLLTACLTPTAYVPYDGRYGYAEEQVDESVYRILFSGNEHTSRDAVNNHLLRRAAELTLELGYERFMIIKSKTEKVPAHQTGNQIACGYGGFYNQFFYYPEVVESHYVGLVYIELISDLSSQPLEKQIPAKEVLNWLNDCSAE
jgi:hypothetical protein